MVLDKYAFPPQVYLLISTGNDSVIELFFNVARSSFLSFSNVIFSEYIRFVYVFCMLMFSYS